MQGGDLVASGGESGQRLCPENSGLGEVGVQLGEACPEFVDFVPGSVPGTRRVVARQRVHQQVHVRTLQILPGRMRVPRTHGGEVAGDLHPGTVRSPDELLGVGQRNRTQMPLDRRPQREGREGLDRQVPARWAQPDPRRTGQPVLGVEGQRIAKLLPVREERDPVGTEVLGPALERLRGHPPRVRARRPADRQLAQPTVHHGRRTRVAAAASITPIGDRPIAARRRERHRRRRLRHEKPRWSLRRRCDLRRAAVSALALRADERRDLGLKVERMRVPIFQW
jgi:hypothetical protein